MLLIFPSNCVPVLSSDVAISQRDGEINGIAATWMNRTRRQQHTHQSLCPPAPSSLGIPGVLHVRLEVHQKLARDAVFQDSPLIPIHSHC